MTTTQHRPAIVMDATPERSFVSALMFAAPPEIRESADLLRPDDLDHPFDTILEFAHTCAGRGDSGAAAVVNELMRAGMYRGPIRREMETLPFAGGVPAGLHHYAEGVLAARYRRHVAEHGAALAELADTAPEHELWPAVEESGRKLKREAKRLEVLRGGDAA